MKHWICGLIFTALSTASWASSCSISLPTGDLGGYEPSVNEAGLWIIQAFWVTCPKGTPLVITTGPSATSGNIANRQMKGSISGVLNYQFCHDHGSCSRIFGDGQVGTPLTANAAGYQQGIYFWTHVFGKQMVAGGEYIDYVAISINP